MKKEIKLQAAEILKTKGFTDAVEWYYKNVKKDYIKARRKIGKLDKKLRDEARYKVEVLKNGYILHVYALYYIYGNNVLKKSFIEIPLFI